MFYFNLDNDFRMGMMVHRDCISIFSSVYLCVNIVLHLYLYECLIPHDVTGNNACIYSVFSILSIYIYMFCNCNMKYTFDIKYISHRKCIFYYLNWKTL